jgi:hypothetical protein
MEIEKNRSRRTLVGKEKYNHEKKLVSPSVAIIITTCVLQSKNECSYIS